MPATCPMEAEKIAFDAHKAGTGWTARRPAHDDRATGILIRNARSGQPWAGSPRVLRSGTCRSRQRADPPMGQREDLRRLERAACGPRSGDRVAATRVGALRRFEEHALASAQR
jgi:hypothetical protein